MRPTRDETPKCFICCNVKVGTFLLASLLLAGGVLTVITASLWLSDVEIPQWNMCNKDLYYMNARSAQWITLASGLGFAFIAIMALHGLVKNRGAHLIPLLFTHVFLFLCSVVYIGTVTFYWPSIKAYVIQCPNIPQEWKQWLSHLDDSWLAAVVFAWFLLDLLFKGFCVSVIYRCYKHLMLQRMRHSADDLEVNCVSNEKTAEGPIYKPPKYEDIQKVPLVYDEEEMDTKPPPYSS